MDQKPDIVMLIDQFEIGRYSMPKVKLGGGIFTRKLVFKKAKYFGLVMKLVEEGRESAIVTSSTGRKYTIEQFIHALEGVDEWGTYEN